VRGHSLAPHLLKRNGGIMLFSVNSRKAKFVSQKNVDSRQEDGYGEEWQR
jgi:hypothetical protein